ncbi:hypothetical protein [Adhaeribacter soli]|uniref:Uncharacterized protein n=1 Tax=Adhaeribacter soli TaxID=2607655 RepID=A0A5N1J5F2_9BACT|nr:hypothetical protein [Adhaeribacter soli]KAA9345924.1 hypothetical protein F0P94_02245 [Adhaeribacter soli]
MKKILTHMLALFLFLGTNMLFAQTAPELAEKQTRLMAAKLKLDDKDHQKLYQFNLQRLEKIEALSKLREQDPRYLDMRLDQIEEEYHSLLFNSFNKKQFAAYQHYKKDQPYTYAGLTMKTNTIKPNNAIAIEVTD